MTTIENMNATAIDLDHAGVAGPDLDRLAASFERLGFTLTPRARHSGRRQPDGPVEPFGTANRCIMLRQGYLELIAIVDPNCYSNGLESFFARHPGLHIIALSIGDETANLRRLRQAGIDIPGVAWLERPVDDADPNGLRARFARLPLPDAPGRPHPVDSPSHPRGDLAAALPRSSPTTPSPWRKSCLPSRTRRSRRRVSPCSRAGPPWPMQRGGLRAELRAQPLAPAAG